MKEYFVIINDQQQGPFTLEQLTEIGITPETAVWTRGMADWQQAGDVADLTPLLQQMEFQQHIHSTPPPYTPRLRPTNEAPSAAEPTPASAWSQTEPHEAQPKKSHRGVKWLIALICLLLLASVLAVTCPTAERHKIAVSEASQGWLSEKVHLISDPLGGLAPLVNSVADFLSEVGIDYILDNQLEVSNYVVCSVGRFNFDNKSTTVSLGVLGHVYTFDKEDVDDYLLKQIKNKLRFNKESSTSSATIEEDDSYLAPPYDEYATDSVEQDEMSAMAQEMLDSLAATAKREAVKGVKKWAKKQLEKLK